MVIQITVMLLQITTIGNKISVISLSLNEQLWSVTRFLEHVTRTKQITLTLDLTLSNNHSEEETLLQNLDCLINQASNFRLCFYFLNPFNRGMRRL